VQIGGKITHLLRLSRDLPYQKIRSWLLLLNHKEVFFLLWFFQADIIENLYSSITHMLLSMHVHFLIITYIHISCIFSELISQYTSVRMTQFFYILIYSIHMKVYCYCLTLNCLLSNFQLYCPIFNCYCLTLNCYCLTFPTVTVWLWTVTVWLFQIVKIVHLLISPTALHNQSRLSLSW